MKITYKHAVEAQSALMQFSQLNLPVDVSIGIARLSNLIDNEVQLFATIRNKLVKDYAIKPSHTDRADMLSFTCDAIGEDSEETQKLKEQQLKEFVDKFQKLLETKTADLPTGTIKLSRDEIKGILLQPKKLKAIEVFIEVV